ncbi:ABC transporter ATP-binding protein [Bacillus sp. OK048]|uniref:ABC transporter ATP-binding protein n=1 Tax=Bacillus sp. OK048 TaxID=1882761 RepID=UPI00087EE561|nr:ABC transporter ATP-binding protein [Bacillus sp. OK048]SDM99276.1 peptide/nickel transport system ATP-binding protein [Bacillus sp. OK048]
MAILEVRDLSISFTHYSKGLRQENNQVIHNLNVSMNKGEIVAVVGSSGSGKSLLAHAILGILPGNAMVGGSILYDGQVLTEQSLANLRGNEIVLVPQSVKFLDPLMKIGSQVQTSVRKQNAVTAQKKIFEKYKLHPLVEKLYPFQLSGGMARRVLVSMAVVSEAKVIIADEPTPGLDSEVMKEAESSFRELANNGSAVMVITHDIDFALKIADKIAVFYAGTVVELAPVRDFFGTGESLRHPYTKALWRALPQNEFIPIKGSQPPVNELPPGCPFAPRCKHATAECSKELPAEKMIRGGMVRCFYAT